MNIETKIDVTEPIFGAKLTALLPQRFPYLMLDRIDSFTPWKRARGVKAIAADEPMLLKDGDDAWPMSFVIESLGQLAIGLINLSQDGDSPTKVLLGNVSGVKFYDPAPLGSLLELEIRIDRVIGDQFIASGRADTSGRPVLTMDSIICKFISGEQDDEN